MGYDILRTMGYMQMELPHQIFFSPTQKFMKVMEEYNNPIIEMGCGTGFALSKIVEHGQTYNIPHMKSPRGFDIHARSHCDAPMHVTVGFNAVDFSMYHKNLNVLICRPDHSGWVELVLDNFIHGLNECKRFIYVGLEINVCKDFTDEQLASITYKHSDMGADGEVMYVWEFN